MNPKFKARFGEIVIGVALLILAAALVAIGIMAFLFVNTRIPVKVGTAIGWICFAVTILYLLKRIFFRYWQIRSMLKPIKAVFSRRRRLVEIDERYEQYKARKTEELYRQTHRPYFETAFGEERQVIQDG